MVIVRAGVRVSRTSNMSSLYLAKAGRVFRRRQIYT
jgi:hypothetical protein